MPMLKLKSGQIKKMPYTNKGVKQAQQMVDSGDAEQVPAPLPNPPKAKVNPNYKFTTSKNKMNKAFRELGYLK